LNTKKVSTFVKLAPVNIKIFKALKSDAELPMFLSGIQMVFPSPADDFFKTLSTYPN